VGLWGKPVFTGSVTIGSTCLGGLEQYPATGCEPEGNFTAGFPTIKAAFCEQDADAGPDTALTADILQRLHNIAYVTTLPIGNRTEDINVGFCGFKDFGGSKTDFFHNFHMIVLVTDVEKTRRAGEWCTPGESPVSCWSADMM